ncbi:hypothetical protein COY95_04500 [Candidatus Woesearchaeota archaeon CG_4_10_14_0_8_um_filter_47_5]|nr:MAG: hypothetical protein COY95_04500 [Candidatus Woesearchaeota archaeon CG_4_10_14_0_8_um_filter_47_5]
MDPVCAENGNSFRNNCTLQAAGLGLWHSGYCYDEQTYKLDICLPEEQNLPRRKFKVDTISILNEVEVCDQGVCTDGICAGDDIELLVTLENTGIYNNKDVSITAVVPDLALRKKAGPFRINAGEEVTKRISIETDNALIYPGLYDVQVYISTDDLHRIRYRDFRIVDCCNLWGQC